MLKEAMSDDRKETNNSSEIFELLGHPTRVKIIELLGEQDQSFSELRRKVWVESSGHLQFHLANLN